MKISLYISFLAVFFAFAPLSGAGAAELADFSVGKKQETITLSVPVTNPHKVFIVNNPDRLVVDVPSVPGKKSLSLPASYKGRLVKAARFGQFDHDTSRFVFDLAKPLGEIKVTTAGNKKQPQLVLVITEGSGKRAVISDSAAKSTAQAFAREKKTAPAPKSPSLPIRETEKSQPKALVVIDPGHGGVDPGTIGPGGTQEKDIVMEFAKALRTKLLKTGRYRVKLTRENDEFIMLRKRIAIARKAEADIFISLHADSAPEQMARGLSVYTVSEKASDQEAEALAARENKSDVLAGMDLSDEQQDVADILISLAQRETKNNSATLADLLVARLGDKVTLLPNSHRFAGFAVLKAPDIPSVLIETGFLSNPKEEKLLNSKAYREKVINGIVSGINAYFDQRRKAGMP